MNVVGQRRYVDLMPRRRWEGEVYHWQPVTITGINQYGRRITERVYFQETPMYYDFHFEIREAGEYGSSKSSVRIDIVGIHALPHVLKRLVEMGYDLTEAHSALSEAVDAQRKRNALDEAVKAMAAPAK